MKETHTMGYNVDAIATDFHVAEDKLPALFEALKNLNKRDELKTGGSWSLRPDGTYGETEKWFAWMPADYDETSTDAEDIFEQLGFDTELVNEHDASGPGLRLTGYSSKSGAEDVFLAAAAPFVTPGSTIEWEGEDGERWRQEFDGTTIITKHGRIIYE